MITSSDSSTIIASNTTSSESSVHSSAGLQVALDVSVITDNGTTSRSLGASLFNPSSTQLILATGQMSLGLGPCSQLPLGVGLFRGYYNAANLSSAVPLNLYQPGTYSCPAMFTVAEWSFSPMSDNVTLVSPQPAGSGNTTTSQDIWTRPAATTVPLSGYWTGENESAIFHQFSPGVYTAAAEDEWGDLRMTSFIISSSSTGTNSSSDNSLTVNSKSTGIGGYESIATSSTNQIAQLTAAFGISSPPRFLCIGTGSLRIVQ